MPLLLFVFAWLLHYAVNYLIDICKLKAAIMERIEICALVLNILFTFFVTQPTNISICCSYLDLLVSFTILLLKSDASEHKEAMRYGKGNDYEQYNIYCIYTLLAVWPSLVVHTYLTSYSDFVTIFFPDLTNLLELAQLILLLLCYYIRCYLSNANAFTSFAATFYLSILYV